MQLIQLSRDDKHYLTLLAQPPKMDNVGRPRFGPPLLHLLHLSFDLVPVRIWFGGEGDARSPSRVGRCTALHAGFNSTFLSV